MKKKFTLFHSLLWILCSAVALNGLAFGGIKAYLYWKRVHSLDFQVPIKAIVQTGPQKEALKTTYLAELLDLSIDKPTLCCEFDLREAQKKLLASPVIKEAKVEIKEPGILYINYTIRQPIVFLHDYKNIALDEDRIPFPVAPFFTPKKLPEVYLDIEAPLVWNKPITGEKIELAFDLYKILEGPIASDLFNIKRIDVSNAFQKNYGKREIVLQTKDEIYTTKEGVEYCFSFPRILRLSTKKYSQELSNYLKYREKLLEKEKHEILFPEEETETIVYQPTKVIDFRISQLAFMEEVH